MLAGVAARIRGLDQVVLWYDESLTLLHISGQHLHDSRRSETEASLKGPLNWQQLIQKYQKSGDSLSCVDEVVADEPHHSPVFYKCLFLWAKAFGDELYELRLLPVLFGVLAIPAFYWLTLELFRSERTALIAAAILSLSPLHICYSQELREYSLLTFVFCLSCAAFIRAWRARGIFNWATYLAITVFSINSSLIMLLVLAAQVAFSSGALMIRSATRGRFTRSCANNWLIHLTTVALAMVIVSPLILNLLFLWSEAWGSVRWTETRISQYVLVRSILYTPIYSWTYQPEFTFRTWDVGVFLGVRWFHRAIFIVECVALVLMLRKAKWQVGFLSSIYLAFAMVSVIPDLLLGGKRTLVVRYLLPVPLIAILPVAFMLNDLLKGKKAQQVIALALAGFLFVCEMVANERLYVNHTREGFACSMTEMADFLNCDPKAPVLADLHSFKWYFPYILALGRRTNADSRSIAYVDEVVPKWVYNIDRAFVIHFDDSMREKYSGFTIEPVGPHNSTVVIIRPRKNELRK